ncbi:MAG: hypothetical protein AB7V27_06160 [Candidatus Binatia bacterium]
MPGEPLFDLELLGYRNDVTRERVLAFLSARPAALAVDAVDRTTALPHRLARGLTHAEGLRLLALLRERGAQVRLVSSATVEALREPVPPPPAPPPTRSRRAGRWVAGALIALLAAAALPELLPPLPARPPRPRVPAAEPAPDASAGPRRLNAEAVALNASGQFADAAQRLRDALRDAPNEPALRQNLQTVLRNWAVAEINSSRPEAAVPLLDEALGMGEEGNLLGALGIARVRQGDWRGGREALDRAVALGVSDHASLTALAEANRQLGDRAAAVEALHHARDAGAGGPEFDTMLARMERELDAEWDFDETRTAHFTIGFAGGAREVQSAADLVAGGLEEAYFHLGTKLDLYPDERIAVVLYPSEDFHDITQTPSWTAGVYDGRIKLPVGGLAAQDEAVLQRTLRHEYGHVLVHRLSRGRCPVWLNEGVAIWGEEERDGERTDWAERTIAGRELLHLSDLAGAFTRLPPDRVPVAYAQSYLAVRELVDRHGAKQLRELLVRLGNGTPLEQAFREARLGELAAFERALIDHLTGEQ